MLTIPNSWGAEKLQEFNPCHDPKDGKFAPKGSAGCKPGASAPAKGSKKDVEGAYRRPPPIRTSDLNKAVKLILEGKVVELPDTRAVNTVLSKLAAIAKDAESRGEKAPTYNLCNVSVPGTNLFCAENIGLDRLAMPQLSGKPVAGSDADKLPKDEKGGVDATKQFLEHLSDLGIPTWNKNISAAKLKASQRELVGSKVAGMMANKKFKIDSARIFVTRDNYVVDGHHRWAATVGRDAKDGRLGDIRMPVIHIDAPIAEVLHLATRWSTRFGIAAASGK
jgi:hypothetical protein